MLQRRGPPTLRRSCASACSLKRCHLVTCGASACRRSSSLRVWAADEMWVSYSFFAQGARESAAGTAGPAQGSGRHAGGGTSQLTPPSLLLPHRTPPPVPPPPAPPPPAASPGLRGRGRAGGAARRQQRVGQSSDHRHRRRPRTTRSTPADPHPSHLQCPPASRHTPPGAPGPPPPQPGGAASPQTCGASEGYCKGRYDQSRTWAGRRQGCLTCPLLPSGYPTAPAAHAALAASRPATARRRQRHHAQGAGGRQPTQCARRA